MRLLAIGYPLPHPDIDNYSVLTAPSYFDYDALFVDPLSLTRMAQHIVDGGEQLEAFDGRPIINGLTTASAVAAADQFRRRLRETERLLEQGGVVLVVARPNATQAGIVGFEGCDRYSWLPAPEGLSWSAPILHTAEGSTVRLTDDHHPLAPIVREFRRFVGYRAVFDARHPAFQRSGRTWAEAKPGLTVGVDFAIGGGRVVFLPAVVTDTGLERTAYAMTLVAAAHELLGAKTSEPPPYWARSVSLPGLAEAEAEAEEQQQAMDRAAERLEDARGRAAEAAIYRNLLWADGPAFREAVRRTFVLLGFEEAGPADAPLALRAGDAEAFIEMESARDEVAEWPYVRLQRRLEERLLRQGAAPKGIVIANGYRGTDPQNRVQQFSEPLRIACENYRYALITSETLLEIVRRAMGDGLGPELLDGLRRRILRGSGLLSLPTLLGESDPDAEVSTLF